MDYSFGCPPYVTITFFWWKFGFEACLGSSSLFNYCPDLPRLSYVIHFHRMWRSDAKKTCVYVCPINPNISFRVRPSVVSLARAAPVCQVFFYFSYWLQMTWNTCNTNSHVGRKFSYICAWIGLHPRPQFIIVNKGFRSSSRLVDEIKFPGTEFLKPKLNVSFTDPFSERRVNFFCRCGGTITQFEFILKKKTTRRPRFDTICVGETGPIFIFFDWITFGIWMNKKKLFFGRKSRGDYV